MMYSRTVFTEMTRYYSDWQISYISEVNKITCEK